MTAPIDGAQGASIAALRTAFVAKGGLIGAWIAHLPAISGGLELGSDDVGAALAALSAGHLVAMPAGGSVATAVGARRLVVIGAVAAAVLSLGPLLAGSLASLAAVMFCFGLANGAASVAGSILGVSVEAASGRRIMSSLFAMHAIGGFLGAGSAAAALGAGVAPLVQVVAYAGVSGCALILLARVLPEDGKRVSRDAGVGGAFRSPAVLCLGFAALAVLLAVGSVQDWAALHLSETLGAPGSIAPLGYAAFSAALMLGCLFGDRVSRLVAPLSFAAASSMIAAAGFAISAAAPTTAVAIAGFSLVGLGLANLSPVLLRIAGSIKDVNPAGAISAASTVGFAGYVIGPIVIGGASAAYGLAAGIALPALLCLAVAMSFAMAEVWARRRSAAAA